MSAWSASFLKWSKTKSTYPTYGIGLFVLVLLIAFAVVAAVCWRRDASASASASASADVAYERFALVESAGLTHSLPIYVINLDHRRERLANVNEQLVRSDLPKTYERVSAVNGTELDLNAAPLTEKARAKLRRLAVTGVRTAHEDLSPGAVGCYLSHLKVWQRVVANRAPVALVLEDDARLPADMRHQVQKALAAVPADWDLIIFDPLCVDCSEVVDQTQAQVLRLHRFYLMHAYLVRPAALRKMLAMPACLPIQKQIDSMLSDESRALRIYGVRAGTAQGGFVTDIQVPINESLGEE